MNKLESYCTSAVWLTILLLSTWLAGCDSRDQVLGTGDIGVVAPTVTGGTPINNAIGVPIITPTFSEPIVPVTGAASFTVTCVAPCVNLAGAVTLDSTSTIATFTPAAGTSLAPLTLYTVTVTGARSIASGLTLASPSIRR